MKKDVLLTVPSYFRDDMNVMGYRFGKGEKKAMVSIHPSIIHPPTHLSIYPFIHQ